jgi:hypothetical protein
LGDDCVVYDIDVRLEGEAQAQLVVKHSSHRPKPKFCRKYLKRLREIYLKSKPSFISLGVGGHKVEINTPTQELGLKNIHVH